MALDPKITPDFINKNFNNNLTELLGIEYLEIGDDYVKGKMPVTTKVMQPFGYLHGGASVVLAESLGSLLSNCLVDQSRYQCFGQEINANHLKSVKEGFVYGDCQAIRIGKRSHVWDIRITNDSGDLVCVSRLTVAVVEKK